MSIPRYGMSFKFCSRCYKDPCVCTRDVLLKTIAVLNAQLDDFHYLSDNIRHIRSESNRKTWKEQV